MLYFIIACVVLVVSYFYFTRNHDYWEKRGVKFIKPLPIFGNELKGFLGKQSLTQSAEELYWKFPDEKVAGAFRSSQPDLIIRDLDLAKAILIEDFHRYPSRAINVGDKDDKNFEILRKNLVSANGLLWRQMRYATSPAFTSGKLRAMFPLIVERTDRLQERVLRLLSSTNILDARELMCRYTTDFIGACGFGIDANTLNDENSAFRKLGDTIFKKNFRDILVSNIKDLFPSFCRNIKYYGRIEQEFLDFVKEIIRQRAGKPSGRHDFIDLMLEVRQKGQATCETSEPIELTDDLIAAQLFMFYAAGFETSSSVTSITLHWLAMNPSVQDKVQADIDRVLAKYNNKLGYDCIKEMKYLQWTLKEGLRVLPPVGALTRTLEGDEKYSFPGLGFSIDPGVRVLVSLQGIHNDPKYWHRPHEFRPERFDPDGENEPKNKLAYMPFGDGPRVCIGERLGRMQSLAGLAAILSRFSLAPVPTAPREPRVCTTSFFVQLIADGLPLVFTERKPSS